MGNFFPGYSRVDYTDVFRFVLSEGVGSVPRRLPAPPRDPRPGKGLTFVEVNPGPSGPPLPSPWGSGCGASSSPTARLAGAG